MRANYEDFWKVTPWKPDFCHVFANRQFNLAAPRATDEGEQLYRLMTMSKLVSEKPHQCFGNEEFYTLVKTYLESFDWSPTAQVSKCEEVIRIVTEIRDKAVVKRLEG